MPDNLEAVNIDKEVWAVVSIPETTVKLTLRCEVYLDDRLQTVEKTMSMTEVQEAINEAKDYIGPDDVFVLTEKGKSLAKELGWDD